MLKLVGMLASLKKLFRWLKLNFFDLLPVSFLVIVVVFISYSNYVHGTWLTGWDNLHPEFNFKLNIARSLNVVWQEHQGLGLLGGMAHAADLSRQVVLLLFSLVIPTIYLRYLWTFLMLIIGPLGVYFLIKSFSSRIGGFIGSVFYLLNLATVQYFFVPFETFVSFYGFLPWLLYFVLKYLKFGKRRDLVWFLVVSLLGTSAFYVQTIFVVFLIFATVLMTETIINFKLKGFMRSIKLALVILVANSFWLLPAFYFSLTNSSILANSKINSIATVETQLMNQGRGSFSDIALLKGYWFDYYDFGKDGKFDYLFAGWMDHVNNPYINRAGVGIFIISLIGLILAIFSRKNTWKFSWIILLGISYLMLSSTNPPFGEVYNYLSLKIPLFYEVFRNSFTKWSVATAFIYSLGLGYFIYFLTILLKGKLRFLVALPIIALLISFIYIVKPVFEGKLVSSRMKTAIPQEYFEAFKFLNQKLSNARIARFPLQSFWGWNFNEWGYGGSGFLWYGIKQPILDRAFDVWSPFNETFYAESARALYASDNEAFERTLRKYQVKYLLLDESIINAGGSEKLLFIPETKEILNMSNNIKEVQKFGFLTIYETNFDLTDKYISTPQSYILVNADLTYSQIDPIYQKYEDYIEGDDGVGYPFVNFDPRGPVSISSSSNELVFENKKANSKVTLPIKEKVVESFGEDRGFSQANNCDLKKLGIVAKTRLDNGVLYRAEGGGVSCDFYAYDDLSYDKAYVLRIKGENKEGRSLKIYLQNWETGRMDLEELLPTGKFDNYFVVLPKLSNKKGYTLNLETRSFGRIASENLVESIEIYPFDFKLLTSLVQNPEKEVVINNNLKVEGVKKVGTAIYKIQTSGNGLLVLGQGYERGWLAFKERTLLEHVKVNSWANGWIVPENEGTVYILFWPQLLECFGFIVLFGSLVTLICLRVDRFER